MVPLKDFFSGHKEPSNPNMVSSQKCIRTVDIDIIGDTDRHLTFFEMLGNFSVGKYFKKEAITHSYNYITEKNSIYIDAGNPDLDGDGITWENDPDDQDPDGSRLDIGAIPYFQDGPIIISKHTESIIVQKGEHAILH